jgi:hypothetical protein
VSGRLVKTSDGYEITIVKDNDKYSYPHEGNLDKNSLLQTLKQIQATLDSQNTQQSRNAEPSYEKPFRGRRSAGKPSEVVDAAVIEHSGGFTIGGLQDPSYIAGSPDNEHWIMASWRPEAFDLFDMSDSNRQFLRRHLAAIAYKAAVGASPDIDYFSTPQMAINRLTMLQQKHGAPGGTAINAQNDIAPVNTPSTDDIIGKLTVDRSVE